MFNNFNTKMENLNNTMVASQINNSLSNQANREANARMARENKRAIIEQAEAMNNFSEVILKVFGNLNENQMENLQKLLSLPEDQLNALLGCMNNKERTR